jgi:WD40 repeat protein
MSLFQRIVSTHTLLAVCITDFSSIAMAAPQPLLQFKEERDAFHAAFSKDGKRLFFTNIGRDKNPESDKVFGLIQVWDLTSNKHLFTIREPDWQISSVALSPDETTIVAVLIRAKPGTADKPGDQIEWENALRLYNAKDGQMLREQKLEGTIHVDGFAPDGKLRVWNFKVSEGKPSSSLEFWDVQGATKTKTLILPEGFQVPRSSPDGRVLAMEKPVKNEGAWAVATESIVLLDAQTGKELRRITRADGLHELVTGSTFSPDGKILALTSAPQPASKDEFAQAEIQFWDVSSGKLLRSIKSSDLSWSLAFSPDGKQFAAADELGTIRLWNTQTGEQLRTIGTTSDTVQHLVFSPNGKDIWSGGYFGASLWDVTGQRAKDDGIALPKTWRAHRGNLTNVAASSDGRVLASAAVHFDDDFKGNVTPKSSEIKTWTPDGTQQKIWRGPGIDIKTLALSADGKMALVAGYTPDREGKAFLWKTDESDATELQHDASAQVARLSADGETLILAGRLGSGIKTISVVSVMETTSLKTRKTFTANGWQLHDAQISSNGQWLAAAGYNYATKKSEVKLWNLQDGLIATIAPPAASDEVGGFATLAFSPDNKLLALGGNSWIKKELVKEGTDEQSKNRDYVAIYDVSNAELKQKLTGVQAGNGPAPWSQFRSLSFSPDARFIVASSMNSALRMWKIGSNDKPIFLPDSSRKAGEVVFLPDGKSIFATADNGTLQLWNISESLNP